MGFLPALLGIGNTGMNFQAQGVTPDQLQDARQGLVNNMSMQTGFINALNSQNGIGNQSNVFQQQQALANQLNNQAQGGGPNPALAQLANTTGQNIANQAGLMGSQRGINANPGLAAQLIGQQGAGLQQQAVGQAATMRAQQQLNAQQQLQQQLYGMGNLATTQVGQQQGSINNLGNLALQNQGQDLQMMQNMNNANASIQAGNAKGQQGLFGGVTNAIGGALSMKPFFGAQGGPVPQGAPSQGSAGLEYLRNMKRGGKVPGKANVSGNSYSNDTVPAMLSPGEIVLPRTVTQAPNANEKAKAFVEAVQKKRGRG